MFSDVKNKKVVALTFDDGPNTVYTDGLIDLLVEYGVTASFFVVGQNITDETKPIIARAHSLGIEIGNHSFSHDCLNELTSEKVRSEVNRTSELIFACTREYPRFFRPPYIAVNSAMYDIIQMPFICGMGCSDWDPMVTVPERIRFLTQDIPDGAIVLLHDQENNPGTPEALRTAIPQMLESGCEFVTISGLFAAKGLTPLLGQMYSLL